MGTTKERKMDRMRKKSREKLTHTVSFLHQIQATDSLIEKPSRI